MPENEYAYSEAVDAVIYRNATLKDFPDKEMPRLIQALADQAGLDLRKQEKLAELLGVEPLPVH